MNNGGTMAIVLLVAGLALLIVGAELLVRGSSRIAAALGIPPLIIGLTVVAFGTSSPELAVSVGSGLTGEGDIALGNVVGSNIFNVLFILGVSALFAPLIVHGQLIRLDLPIQIGISILVLLLSFDGSIARIDGVILFAGIIGYTAFLVVQSSKESKKTQGEYAKKFGREKGNHLVNFVMVLGGLGLLVLGARWLVNGAVTIAQSIGVSEVIIGLTIVAAGTSLPEVATSVIASLKGERDIAVGNVVGSCIFNLLAVLGLTALLVPGGVPVAEGVLNFDLPVMIATSMACLPIFFTGHLIARWEGGVFVAYYVAYTAYLILEARGHRLLPAFSQAMLWFVLPLTALTLAVIAGRAWRRRKG